MCRRAISGTHLQFCCRRCSTWGPYSLGQAVQGSPRYGWRNPVSVQLMASSPCQLDDDEHSEVEIIIPQSVRRNESKQKGVSSAIHVSVHQNKKKKTLSSIMNPIKKLIFFSSAHVIYRLLLV